MIGTLATMLSTGMLIIIIVAGFSYFWIVAPLQGSLDLVANKIIGNTTNAEGKHGYKDETLRAHKLIGETYAELTSLIDDFQKLAENLTKSGSQVAIASAEVSHAANNISSKAHEDVETVSNIADSASRISDIVAEQASLRPRERFWDIQVPKIDSAFDNLLVPRTSWSPTATR